MVYLKIVKRVNPKSSHHKDKTYPFVSIEDNAY